MRDARAGSGGRKPTPDTHFQLPPKRREADAPEGHAERPDLMHYYNVYKAKEKPGA